MDETNDFHFGGIDFPIGHQARITSDVHQRILEGSQTGASADKLAVFGFAILAARLVFDPIALVTFDEKKIDVCQILVALAAQIEGPSGRRMIVR